ncbi:DUF2157 domain-containing protein [Niabella sp. CJ426]|uniref:DUF2157 domain-containing protein n=1 Tax=Niabella sp. CJ426 TaxID=3393740 RepID=UPI003D03FB9E
MNNIEREDVHIVSRHSNLDKKKVAGLLEAHVYNNKEAWQKFLQLFFITLGIGFTVAGIIFFFAYNWASLHKFAKIGLVEALIMVTTGLIFLPKLNANTRNIILTGAAALVGVLFAVFGQVYQTGANAYDFFLAWVVFITLWAVVSNFAPLWLLYLLLINTTVILYTQQVAKDWDEIFIFTLLFVVNALVLFGFILLSKYKKDLHAPGWFLNTIALASVTYATIGMVIGVFEGNAGSFPFLVLFTIVAFAVGILYGLKARKLIYLSIIPLSMIIILSALLLKTSDYGSMLLFVCMFIIGSVTLVIKGLLSLQRQWNNEASQLGLADQHENDKNEN